MLDLARIAVHRLLAVLAVLVLGLASAAAQQPVRDGPESLAAARRLLATGAPLLALQRIEQSQQAGSTRWAEWEALRLGALSALGRWTELAARAQGLSAVPELPAPFLRTAWLAGAEAALLGVPGIALAAPGGAAPPAPSAAAIEAAARARDLAGRAIWSATPTPDEVRRAQVLVIESLFAGGEVAAGYRSILRYRQDVPAPAPPAAARFLLLMAAHGQASEALPLLPLLPESHPVRIAVQVRLGVLTPPGAAALARQALRPSPAAAPARPVPAGTAGPATGPAVPVAAAVAGPPPATSGAWAAREWLALREAIAPIDPLSAAGAAERALDADPMAPGADAAARSLWRDYLVAAPGVANREQLLVGDPFGWSDAASRIAGRDPLAARVLFAHLSVHAPEAAAREAARLQLAGLLREAGLGGAAARLFLDRPAFDPAFDPAAGAASGAAAGQASGPAFDPARHPPELRRLLSEAAAGRRLHALAADLRQGLGPRPGEDADDWRLAAADLQARAGRLDEALRTLLSLFAGSRSAMPRPAAVVRMHALADLFADAGDAAGAARIREAAGPLPAPARRP